jgi:hypothetical protein
MANETGMTEMETSDFFSLLKMAFIRFTSSWMGKISSAICIKDWEF